MTYFIFTAQELLTVYLRNLEARKEQEAGNRRSVEQAADDIKVKHDLLLY